MAEQPPAERTVFVDTGYLLALERQTDENHRRALGHWRSMREAARARGRKGGRKPVMDEKKLALASAMLKNREIPITEVCEAVGVSRSTLYRHLKPDGSVR